MRKQGSWLRRLLAPAIRPAGALARDQRGAVAVEFAILALPFFTLIFAIIETAVVFLGQQILESGVQDASRLITTGQARSYDLSAFRTELCSDLYGLFDCSKVQIKVSPVGTSRFSDFSVTNPIRANCTPTPSDQCWNVTQGYDGGSSSSVMLVQAYYKWPTWINLPLFNFSNQTGGTRLLAAVRIFQNEPY